MQADYQVAANQLQEQLEEIVSLFKQELTKQGLDIEVLSNQPIAVEIVSFALVNCLTKERLAADPFENESQAYQEALQLIKSAVIKYRGSRLVPPPTH